MKILVYGAGVNGCYLAHVLCTSGDEVTLRSIMTARKPPAQNDDEVRI